MIVLKQIIISILTEPPPKKRGKKLSPLIKKSVQDKAGRGDNGVY